MQSSRKQFLELFGAETAVREFFCPGRVNLIGEHIDHQGGSVLPVATSMGISALCAINDSKKINVFSNDFLEFKSFNLQQLSIKASGDWGDFVLGVIRHLGNLGVDVPGCNILLSSNLPKASGLSSSAALEVLVYYSLYQLATGSTPDRVQMALGCQEIENSFIGVKCGIMDQFAVSNAKRDHAILLNCSTLDHRQVPMRLNGCNLLIINSNRPRTLASSAYNTRLAECAKALADIRREASVENLVDATTKDLKHVSTAPLKKRTQHVISEQHRVIDAAKALESGQFKRFGHLMNESHDSLRYDFEVSCPELNFIVDSLREEEYCLGARMTGAGFGGCCIALIKEDQGIQAALKKLDLAYRKQFGYAPSVYNCIPSDGVHAVTG